jgi:hypothetical protein
MKHTLVVTKMVMCAILVIKHYTFGSEYGNVRNFGSHYTFGG